MIWTNQKKSEPEIEGKERPIKNTWYDWLINHIPEPIRKHVGGFKEKVFLRQTHLIIMVKKAVYGSGKKLS